MRILIAGGFLSCIVHVRSGHDVGLKLRHSHSRPTLNFFLTFLPPTSSGSEISRCTTSKSTTRALAFQTGLEARLRALVKMVLYDQSPVIENQSIPELLHRLLFRSSLVQRSKAAVGTRQSQLPLATIRNPPLTSFPSGSTAQIGTSE